MCRPPAWVIGHLAASDRRALESFSSGLWPFRTYPGTREFHFNPEIEEQIGAKGPLGPVAGEGMEPDRIGWPKLLILLGKGSDRGADQKFWMGSISRARLGREKPQRYNY